MLASKQLFLKYVLKRRPENLQLEPLKMYAGQNISESILGEIGKKLFSLLTDFAH